LHSCGLESSSMITSKHGKAKDMSENANRGTASLKKRRRMTQNQAHYSCMSGRADLHMHSTYSDGLGTIQQILQHVEHTTDLNVIALTDHNVVEGALRARDLWAKGNYRLDFIVGEEISTKEGHMLALFIERRIPANLRYLCQSAGNEN
jgi:DNA polymerase III alpha subunit (gram-positive type)